MAAVSGPLLLLTAPFLAAALPGHKPLSNVDPGTLFSAVQREAGAPSSKMEAAGKRPYPTNAWWENFVLATDPGSDEANIFPMPYILIANSTELKVMQPFLDPGSGGSGWLHEHALELTAVGAEGPHVKEWDELSLTLGWNLSGSASMVAPIVRGSPYVTAEYTKAVPVVRSRMTLAPVDGKATISVDGKHAPCDGSTKLSGSVFSMPFLDSDATWLAFAPVGVQFTCSPAPFTLTATGPVTGALRIAVANSCTTGTSTYGCDRTRKPQDVASYAALLESHASSYPTSAKVGFEVSGDKAVVTWDYGVKSLGGSEEEQGPVLQLAWPVHTPLFAPAVQEALGSSPVSPFHDVRGRSQPIVGSSWQMTYQLFPDVGFQAPRPVAKDMEADVLKALKSPGAKWNGTAPDSEFDLPLNFQLGAGDTYFSGKMLARLARLVVIADEVGESGEAYFKVMLSRLQQRIEVWLGRHSSANPLLFDSAWGGIVACGCNYDDCQGNCTPKCDNEVSAAGCPALSDPGANFGNGFYNDHHFHYGYFTYAAAVAAKYNPAWEKTWREQILAIIRDFANPSSEDASFPVVRHMDWFLGFSWAGGVPQAQRNGRNQESTSEAINAYYSLYLYASAVPAASHIKDLGRLLTAMETHGADTYWHVRPNSSTYGSTFKHPVVGILWEHLPEFQTWFGAAPFFVHGIQQIPYTPINEYFLKPDWVSYQFPQFKEACDGDGQCVTAGWSWMVCMEQAFFDVAKALDCVQQLPKDAFSPSNAGSNGHSLTASLHWIATRGAPVKPSPAPAPPSPPPSPPPAPSPPPSPSPGAPCKVGDSVACPGNRGMCAGDQCCMDGSACPSANTAFKGCPRGKSEDCTNDHQELLDHLSPFVV